MSKPVSKLLHRPILLNDEELADPTITISNFLHSRSLCDHRHLLWSILKAALISKKDDYTTATEVADWVIYFRELEAFIEAVFLLHENRSTPGRFEK